MREIGFITLLPETFGVFINNSNVGTIRKHGDVFQFTLGKSRKPMDSEALRAIALKLEVMNGKIQ
jgi:hypothetical protein